MDDSVLYVASLDIGCTNEPPAVGLLSSQLKGWKLFFVILLWPLVASLCPMLC